ncbi:MAG: zf-HC2 domain-containing protein [Lachnospiraceae bacterium]|nr:zf-HC2 domain-containing protein [Lachnospiraceae bacterium]
MDCKVAKQLMPDYLMGMTDNEVKKEFEEHIKECESCSKALEELKKAGQEYDKKDGAEPLKKVNKVIKKHKRGKILAIIGALILVVIVAVFVLGELYPDERRLPSITKMRYKQKAKEVIDEFFDNDMESLLNGNMSYLIAGAANLPNSKAKCVEDMIVDYCEQLKNINDGFLAGRGYKIEKCDIWYKELHRSFLRDIYPDEDKYKKYNYEVYMEISTDLGDFSAFVRFYNDDNYELIIEDSDENAQNGEFQSKMRDMDTIMLHVCRFASGADPFPNIIGGRLTDQNYENGFVGVGKIVVTDDCHRLNDDTYINGFNERLEDIYYNSKTESFNLVARDYNFKEHAVNTELIWVIEDLNGHEAVVRKNMLYGPYGYQKLDDEANVLAEDGFDKELEQKIRNLF